VRRGRAAEAVSAGKEDEVNWLDFEGLIEAQSDVSHSTEWDADAAAEIVHELLDLTEVSNVGTEVSRGHGIDWSTLCDRDSRKQERNCTLDKDRDFHVDVLKEYTTKNCRM
jgi:hypothetical protein